MSLRRPINYNEVKEWSENPGILRGKLKNNDRLIVTSDKVDEVKSWLNNEQIHYRTIGNGFFILQPTNLNSWNMKQNNDFLERVLEGIKNRITSYQEGKLFIKNPTALRNDIDYGLNTQFMRELREQLLEKSPDLLKNFDNSVEILKKSI